MGQNEFVKGLKPDLPPWPRKTGRKQHQEEFFEGKLKRKHCDKTQEGIFQSRTPRDRATGPRQFTRNNLDLKQTRHRSRLERPKQNRKKNKKFRSWNRHGPTASDLILFNLGSGGDLDFHGIGSIRED
jgi:hypothetical protein